MPCFCTVGNTVEATATKFVCSCFKFYYNTSLNYGATYSFVFFLQPPEIIFHGNGTDEAFHAKLNTASRFIERWAKSQVSFFCKIKKLKTKLFSWSLF
jgi:hypothetical protein